MNLNPKYCHPRIQSCLVNTAFSLDILRLDELDPFVSGNKYFKLAYHIQQALRTNKDTLVTFGGGYSNHLLATAYYGYEQGLRTIGMVRGNYAHALTPTLRDCIEYGMHLVYLHKTPYLANKKEYLYARPNQYVIPEGGYGVLGAKGIETLFLLLDLTKYTHLVISVGTGTSMAGILNALEVTYPPQCNRPFVLGFTPLKEPHSELKEQVKKLLRQTESTHFDIKVTSFAGFGKYPTTLLSFIEWFENMYVVPLDKVYTAKSMYTLLYHCTSFISREDKVLFVHTGGLQGNRH